MHVLLFSPVFNDFCFGGQAWIFLARDVEFPADKLGDPSVFAEWAAPGALQAEHPAGRRVVTVPGSRRAN